MSMQVSPGFSFLAFFGEFLGGFWFCFGRKKKFSVCGWKFCALRFGWQAAFIIRTVRTSATGCHMVCCMQQLVRRPLIAGNCRLLTFIKTINKFTHIFSHQNVAFSICTTCRKQREHETGAEEQQASNGSSGKLMEHKHVAHVQCINILTLLHFVDSFMWHRISALPPLSSYFPRPQLGCRKLQITRIYIYVYIRYVYAYQLLCMINARLIFQFISQFPKLTTLETKFAARNPSGGGP